MVVGEFTTEVDIAVIGAGPAGCAAALRARALGASVAIVSAGGGPGRTWSAHQQRLGISGTADRVVGDLEQADITLVHGRARFEDRRKLHISDGPAPARLRFGRVIIAAGGEVQWPTGLDANDPRLADGKDGHTLVVGGGPEAFEWAAAALADGDVTLAPMGETMLANVEPAIAESLVACLRDTGLQVAEPEIDFSNPAWTRIVVASERRATAIIGTEHTSVDPVAADEHGATTNPRVFAAGSIVGATSAEMAAHQGRAAADAATGRGDSACDATCAPIIVATNPAVASCGLTLAAATANGIAARAASLALAPGTPDVALIIIEDGTDLVLGASAMGPGAPRIAAALAAVIEMGAVADDVTALALG